jgi:hypothetical protein
MLEDEGILESQNVREPWNDHSKPIYERLLLKKNAKKNGLQLSDTLLNQLASDRDATQESDDHMQLERRESVANFFSGMQIQEMEDIQSSVNTKYST